jgi:hypothetical protein
MIQETNHLEPVDARSTLHNILTHSGDSRELVGYLNVFLNDLQTYADACGPKPVSDKHVLYRIVHEVIVWLETISLPREHIRCSQMKSLLEPFDVRVQLKSFIEKPCVSHILDREHDLLDIIEGESDVTPQDIGIKISMEQATRATALLMFCQMKGLRLFFLLSSQTSTSSIISLSRRSLNLGEITVVIEEPQKCVLGFFCPDTNHHDKDKSDTR